MNKKICLRKASSLPKQESVAVFVVKVCVCFHVCECPVCVFMCVCVCVCMFSQGRNSLPLHPVNLHVNL